MSTVTLASTHTPTLNGYVHVFNKTTRKSQFLSPQPNAILAEMQSEFESLELIQRMKAKAITARQKLEALFH